MSRRSWDEIIDVVRETVTTPMPIGRIQTKCRINSTQFKRLKEEGIVVYVDSKRQEFGGSYPQRHIAVKEEV